MPGTQCTANVVVNTGRDQCGARRRRPPLAAGAGQLPEKKDGDQETRLRDDRRGPLDVHQHFVQQPQHQRRQQSHVRGSVPPHQEIDHQDDKPEAHQRL